jgi:tetratricopeptide (TPR) repeat protein
MLRFRPLLLLAALAGGGAALAAAGPGEIELPSPRVDWRALETPNFRIVGDASAKKLREIGESLEQFRATLRLLKPQATASSPVPTLVLAFSSRKGFAPYGHVGLEPGREVAGIFHRTPWGNYIVFNSSASAEDPLSVVYHEYTHFFVGTNYASTPLWLNEGLAEFYSTFHATSSGLQIGRPVRYHVLELREGWKLPLARMLAVRHSDPEYREGDKAGPFYAQSWLLAHFVQVGDRSLSPRLVDLLGRIDRGEPLEQAFPAAFGTSFGEMERRLVDYARQPTFQYLNYNVTDLGVAEVDEPVEIQRAEALALLGEYLAHVRAFDAARAHLEAAAALDPSNGDVVALLGYLEQEQGSPERATQLYERALGLSLRRASSAAHAARFALDRGTGSGGAPAADPGRLAMARRASERAIELDPDYGEPWLLKGLVELQSNDAQAALVSFAEAQRRLPDRVDVAYNRFQAAFAAGLTTMARGLAEGSLRRLDPELAAQAMEQLEWKETNERIESAVAESNRRLEAGELDAAAAPLREVLPAVHDDGQRDYLERQIAYVDQWVTEKRRIDAYNRAISLANAQKLREAVGALDALIAECGDDAAQICAAARDLHAELEGFLRRR